MEGIVAYSSTQEVTLSFSPTVKMAKNTEVYPFPVYQEVPEQKLMRSHFQPSVLDKVVFEAKSEIHFLISHKNTTGSFDSTFQPSHESDNLYFCRET